MIQMIGTYRPLFFFILWTNLYLLPIWGLAQEPVPNTPSKKDQGEKPTAESKDKIAAKQSGPHYIRQGIVSGKVVEVNDERHCVVLEVPVNPKNKIRATFIVTDDAKIRTRIIPTLYDDRGNLKKPSPKELAELRGKDKNLPGYESEFGNLKRDQVLLVHQVTTKEKLLAERQKSRPKPGNKNQQEEYMANYIEIISEIQK